MKVLVTGISGQLGRIAAVKLLERGYEVVGLDRRPWPEAPAAGHGMGRILYLVWFSAKCKPNPRTA